MLRLGFSSHAAEGSWKAREPLKMRNIDLDVVLAAFHCPTLGGAAVGGGVHQGAPRLW